MGRTFDDVFLRNPEFVGYCLRTRDTQLAWLQYVQHKAGGHHGAELERTVAELEQKLEKANQRIARLERMFTSISSIAALAAPEYH